MIGEQVTSGRKVVQPKALFGALAASAQRGWPSLRLAAILVGLFALALLIRVWDLRDLPPNLHVDDGNAGMAALNIVNGLRPAYYDTALQTNPESYWWYYPKALTIVLFGRNEVGLRMDSAIMGALCVPFMFLLARKLYDERVAAFASLFLATSYVHNLYSRHAFINIGTVLLTIVSLWLIVRIRESCQDRDLIALGVVAAVAQYGYAGRTFILLAIGLLFLPLLIMKRLSWRKLLVFVAVFSALTLPLFVRYPDWLVTRHMADMSIFKAGALSHMLGRQEVHLPADILQALKINLVSHVKYVLGMWPDASASPDIPVFDAITGGLMAIGFPLLLWRLARRPNFSDYLVLVYFLPGFITAGILTIDAPNTVRLIVVIPAVFLITAKALSTIGAAVQDLRTRAFVLALLLVLSCGLNLNAFFNDLPMKAADEVQMALARGLRDVPAGYTSYFLSVGNARLTLNIYRFMVGDDIPVVHADTTMPADQKVVVVVTTDRVDQLRAFADNNPGGALMPFKSPRGETLYYTYRRPDF